MPGAGEHKTVQARILKYAQEIDSAYVPRAEAEARRGFIPHPSPLPQGKRKNADGARNASPFFGDLSQVRAGPLEHTQIG